MLYLYKEIHISVDNIDWVFFRRLHESVLLRHLTPTFAKSLPTPPSDAKSLPPSHQLEHPLSNGRQANKSINMSTNSYLYNEIHISLDNVDWVVFR